MDLAHRLETALVRGALALMRALGPVAASNLGGAIARAIGPFLPVSDVARRNLAVAMPELSRAAREAVLRGVWDNLGRTAAELAHVARLTETASGPGFEVQGREHVPRGGTALLVSAHIGNWEVLAIASARLGLPIATFYRAAANRGVDALIAAERRRVSDTPSFAKGASGAKGAMAWLRGGGALGMLVDQKMNDGTRARFFGLPAMTATAAAAFALRYGCKVTPARAMRLGPARLRVIIEEPIPLPNTGDRLGDVAALTQAINDRLELWIRERPEQWLWLHRRWPKEVTAGSAAPESSPTAPSHPRPRS